MNILKRLFKKRADRPMIDGWDRLPVGLFVEILRTIRADIDEDEKALQCAAILSRMTYNDLINLSLDETRDLVQRTAFLYTEPKPKRIQKNYNLNGRTYVPMTSMEEMTTAQFIDFQSIIENIDDLLPEFLSIFLVPKGHTYNDGYDQKQSIRDISERLSVEEALGLASFFVNAYKRFAKRTLLYSTAAAEIMAKVGPKEQRAQMAEMAKALEKARKGMLSLFG